MIVQPRGQQIRVDQVRYLKSEFSKSAVEGNQKVFIIDGADRMTVSAANSLLKFIEEPADNVYSFLLTTNRSAILPTVMSRTQVVELPTVSSRVFDHELKAARINPNQYNLLAVLTNDVKTAQAWNVNHWFGKVQRVVEHWFDRLVAGHYVAFPLVQMDLMPLVHKHRDREIVVEMLIQIWCDVLHVKFEDAGPDKLKFPQSYPAIKRVAARITTNQLVKIVDLTLENCVLLSWNVNFQNILEMTTLKTLAELQA